MDLRICWVSVILLALSDLSDARRGGGRRKGSGRGRGGRGRVYVGGSSGRNIFTEGNLPPEAAKISRSSFFYQTYKLGYKIILICIAEGDPTPYIRWTKMDGIELEAKPSLHRYEVKEKNRIKSKVEIDPATIGDQGIYTCHADNHAHGFHFQQQRSFKTEYYY